MFYVRKPKPHFFKSNKWYHYAINYRDPKDLKYKIMGATTLKDAWSKYESLKKLIDEANLALERPLDVKEHLYLDEIKEICSKLHMDPSEIISEYEKCHNILNSNDALAPLSKLCPEYTQWRKKNNPKIKLGESLSGFIEYLRDRKDGETDLQQKHTVNAIKRFIEDFGAHRKVTSITIKELEDWIDNLKNYKRKDGTPDSPMTKRGYKGYLSSFFTYCQNKKVIKENIMKHIATKKIVIEPTFYSVDEAQKLLYASLPSTQLRLFLALALFSGMRHREILALKGCDVHWDSSDIVLDQSITKTSRRRVVKISSNLKAWMKPYQHLFQTDEKFITFTSTEQVYSKTTAIAVKAGVEYQANGFRHTCASYLAALNQDADKTASQMGHSVTILNKNYRGLVSHSEALKYFNIYPKD